MSNHQPNETTPGRRRWARASAAVLVGGALTLGAFAVGTRSGASNDVVPAATPDVPSQFVGIAPERVLDTRGTDGGPIGVPAPSPLGEAETLDVQIAGVGSVPEEAVGVAVNITIDDDATTTSFLAVWPTGEPIPPASASINNATPGIIVQNTALLKLGTDGKITIYNSIGQVNVIIDVTGYFIDPANPPASTTTTTAASTTAASTTAG